MSYTPHTWVDNETITAAKLNNIEDGVQEAAQSGGGAASVIVNFNEGGIIGSVIVFIAYAKYNSTIDAYSIESPMTELYSVAPYRARFYLSVPLTESNDDFKPFIFFRQDIDSIAVYTVTGDISSTKIVAQCRTDSNTWSSEPFYGFEVQGGGRIDIFYND